MSWLSIFRLRCPGTSFWHRRGPRLQALELQLHTVNTGRLAASPHRSRTDFDIFWWALLFPHLLQIFTYFLALALHHFFKRRITFAQHLQDSNSALTTSRYFRLMAMAVVEIFWGILLIGINMWFTCRNGLRPWISWEDVHSNFSRVGLFPEILIPPSVLRWTYFSWWSIPASSILFFSFFAFGQDAVKEYSACFQWVRRVIFRRQVVDSKLSSYGTAWVLPVYLRFVDLLMSVF